MLVESHNAGLSLCPLLQRTHYYQPVLDTYKAFSRLRCSACKPEEATANTGKIFNASCTAVWGHYEGPSAGCEAVVAVWLRWEDPGSTGGVRLFLESFMSDKSTSACALSLDS